eukprot:612927_1
MGCCGNQEEEPVVGEDLELGQDGSAVDEIETYEQSVEKMLGVSSGVQIALGVMAVIQVLVVCVLAWLAYQYYSPNSVRRLRRYPYTGATIPIDGMDSDLNEYSPLHMGQQNVDDDLSLESQEGILEQSDYNSV